MKPAREQLLLTQGLDKVAISWGKVLIIGGGVVGCELADMLANPGYDQRTGHIAVTIVEMLPDIGLNIIPQTRMLVLPRLQEKGGKVIASAGVKPIIVRAQRHHHEAIDNL